MVFNGTNAVILQTMFYIATNTILPNSTSSNNEPVINKDSNSVYSDNKGEVERCYPTLDCYSIDPPWTDVVRPVANFPQSLEEVKPNFCLYTRKNPIQCQHLWYSNTTSITESYLIPFNRVYIITHGFLEGGDRPWIRRITSELLLRNDVNVIVLDWGSGSAPPYTQAVANIRLVGTVTALLIKTMSDVAGIRPEFCHMIGHSLGSHLAGYVGENLNRKFGLKLGRITGLDPADPHFRKTDKLVRLDPSDAIFVDVIHSDATSFMKGALGMAVPIGHLDFYPNGGSDQPGCNEGMMKFINQEEGSFVRGLRSFVGCNHLRSHEYFIESINTECNFLAVECESWEKFQAGDCFECEPYKKNGKVCAQFGLTSVQSVHTSIIEDWQKINRTLVKLYTITGSEWPFCRALYRVTTIVSNSSASIEHGGEIGDFEITIAGSSRKTEAMKLYKEQHYKPGSEHKQVLAGPSVGLVVGAELKWTHHTTLNFLTWRIHPPSLYIKSVRIDILDPKQTIYLCPKNEVFISGKSVELQKCSDIISSS